eukprot:210760_1
MSQLACQQINELLSIFSVSIEHNESTEQDDTTIIQFPCICGQYLVKQQFQQMITDECIVICDDCHRELTNDNIYWHCNDSAHDFDICDDCIVVFDPINFEKNTNLNKYIQTVRVLNMDKNITNIPNLNEPPTHKSYYISDINQELIILVSLHVTVNLRSIRLYSFNETIAYLNASNKNKFNISS